MTDYEEQFAEKVRLIAEEELQRVKRKQFRDNLTKYIKDKQAYYKRNPEALQSFLGRSTEINDYDYQMDLDTELSLANQTEQTN